MTAELISDNLFARSANRQGSDSGKWKRYGQDMLPLWVADMDFRSPQPILDALHERVDHGVFGYGGEEKALAQVFCQRLADFYDWDVTPDQLIFLPGLVCGLNVVSRAVGAPGDGVLVQTPVYGPFLSAPINQDRVLNVAELACVQNGNTMRYEIDYDIFEAGVTDQTRLFILCNPHNPVGRSFTRDEQVRMAEICVAHDLIICSDEIHNELLLGDTQHVPMAAIDPEISQRTVTLMAPSKTFNVPGLGCSIAIVQNPELKAKVQKAAAGIVPHVNLLGYAAALAAYQDGEPWRHELLRHLTAMRDHVIDTIHTQMPGIKTTVPESTYLLWMDCRDVIDGSPQEFFMQHAQVALSDGNFFGDAGKGFVRLNMGTCQNVLDQALGRMAGALTRSQ